MHRSRMIEDAACACGYTSYPGHDAAPDVELAREVLEASGIPCHVAVFRSEPDNRRQVWHELRVLDPEVICAGLLDRAKRLKRVYAEEIARRGAAWQ